MIEAIAWSLGATGTSWAIAWTIVQTKRKPTCEFHTTMVTAFTSDIASIKTGIMKVTAYVADKSTQEGRDLNKEIMDSMMKH